MLSAAPDGSDFLDFSDLLTGYRLSMVLMLAHRAGIFSRAGGDGCEKAALLTATGWDGAYGERFLRCLCGFGLLTEQEGIVALSPFAARFLQGASPQFQGKTLQFEEQLQGAWQQLEATLRAGRRVFAVEEKRAAEYRQALDLYLGAMDEAARIRAAELWDTLAVARDPGTILDLGGGSGAYLAEFLARNPKWRAVFCDLPEVAATTALRQSPPEILERISWCPGNLLAQDPAASPAIEPHSCDLVLLSNLVHCQGEEETGRLLQLAGSKTAAGGMLVIHDFFSDVGWRGALYDLHMLVNTYNGRTYPVSALQAMI